MVYDKVESTGWKWLNIQDPKKQLLGFVLAVTILLGFGFVLALNAVATAKDQVIDSQQTTINAQLKALARKDSIIERGNNERNRMVERFYDKAMSVGEKVHEIKENTKK